VTIRSERERLYAFFSKAEGFKCFRSDANFVLVRVPSDYRERLKQHLESEGVFIKFFSADHTGLDDYVRITVGTPRQNSRLLDSIATFLKLNTQVAV
jgi:histidinol-phosphate aminotransferase